MHTFNYDIVIRYGKNKFFIVNVCQVLTDWLHKSFMYLE